MDAPKNAQSKSRALLDIPAVTPLERRLNVLSPHAGGPKPGIGPVDRSSVLDRLKGFIPQMKAANEQLEQQMQERPAEEFDLEAVNEDAQEGYIEMDLACGVLDLLDESAVAAADRAIQGIGQQAVVGADEDDSDKDDSTDDEGDAQHDTGEPAHEVDSQDATGQGAGQMLQDVSSDDNMIVDESGAGAGSGVGERVKVKAKRKSKIEELS